MLRMWVRFKWEMHFLSFECSRKQAIAGAHVHWRCANIEVELLGISQVTAEHSKQERIIFLKTHDEMGHMEEYSNKCLCSCKYFPIESVK